MIYGANLGTIIAFMVLIWLLSLILKDSSIVDITWGLGFVLIAWLTFYQVETPGREGLLLPILVSAWGLRLALHIGIRNLGKGEDPRYQAFRKKWGDRYWWGSFFQVFLLQGILCWLISLVVQTGLIFRNPGPLTWVAWLGAAVWLVGFFFEVVGDWQLTQFKADAGNKGKVMNRGLWYYTRHPNYFGEAVMWWGIFIIGLETLSNAWTIISPAIITFLLLKVSGVVMLERTIVKRRPEYAEYIERTNAFIPWFPKPKNRSA